MPAELCYMSAVEALTQFKAKELSPVELLKTLIERAEQVEPLINAFTYEYYDEALAMPILRPADWITGVRLSAKSGVSAPFSQGVMYLRSFESLGSRRCK